MTTDIEDLIVIKNELLKTNKDEFDSLTFIKKIKKDFKITLQKLSN